MDNLIDLPGEALLTLVTKSKRSQRQFAKTYGLDYEHLHSKCNNAQQREKRGSVALPVSSYPKFDNPLTTEGDAVILFDTEFPFHNADFINRVLDLGQAWDIRQGIIGGDVLHFDCFSQWEANWVQSGAKTNSLTEEKETELREKIQALPPELQAPLLDTLTSITQDDHGEPDEVSQAKQCLEVLGQAFDGIDYVIGNHDDRFLRALNSPLMPKKLLDFIGLQDPKWRIAPFYRSILVSAGEKYQIEHPKGASANTPVRLADKFECHIIAGHSHIQNFQWSTSGRYYAIASGCCVDEDRLAYAATRSTNRPAHKLGAVIVRDGVPYLLHPKIDWGRMKRM
jgi:hypothetical protein